MIQSLVKNTHKTFKKEVGTVNFCEGCKQKMGENYCNLFDDILSYENCVFKDDKGE